MLSHYSFVGTFEEARKEPLIVLHTSGTTGLPKPIIWTHDWAATAAQQLGLEPPPGFDNNDKLLFGVRLLGLMAPFHASQSFPLTMTYCINCMYCLTFVVVIHITNLHSLHTCLLAYFSPYSIRLRLFTHCPRSLLQLS